MNQPKPGPLPLLDRTNIPTTSEDLFSIFNELGIEYQVYDHEPIFTVQQGEEQGLKGHIPGLHCKNLFLKDKKGALFLVVLPNQKRPDLPKLQTMLGSDRLSFASEQRLNEYLGIYAGAVCPFAVVNDKARLVNVILDKFMMASNPVAYHPLDNAKTVTLSPQDLLKFLRHTGHEPKILDLPQTAPT